LVSVVPNNPSENCKQNQTTMLTESEFVPQPF
jgi:hypothetical protein